MALLVTAGVGFLQAAILFGRKAPLLVSLYANSGVETRLAVYGFLANFGARRFPKGERKALWCARRRIPLAPVGGRRADYGANGGAAAPSGAVLSFEAKESTKESQRHGDYGKKPFTAHFDGGARNVARNGVGQRSPTSGARSCSPFSAVKMGGPFSLRCLSPLCSPAGGAGQTQIAALGMLRCGWAGFAAQKNRIDFFFCELALSIRK